MALESLKDAYYSLEDKIGKRGIAAFIIVIIIILCLVLFLFFFQPQGEMKIISLTIADSSGNPLEGATANYSINGAFAGEQTSDETGLVSFKVPMGSEVTVTVPAQTISGIQYEKSEDTFTVSDDTEKEITLSISQQEERKKTIIFQSKDGKRITGKRITVRLSCSNGFSLPQETVLSGLDGTMEVIQPKGCDILTAVITGPQEFLQKTAVIDSDSKIIQLESAASTAEKGNLRIRVKDTSGKSITATSFTVTIRKPDGYKVNEKETQTYGDVLFTALPAETYNVSVEDEEGDYPIVNLSGIKIQAGKTIESTATMSKTSAVTHTTIKIKVKDANTQEYLEDVAVELRDSESGDTIAEDNTGSDAEQVTFIVTETGPFSAFLNKEGYYYHTEEIGTGNQDITIVLHKIPEPATTTTTDTTTGTTTTVTHQVKVVVKVVDETLNPIQGAKVALRNSETDFLASPYRITDFNGIAEFFGMPAGSYYAYASKEPYGFADDKSDETQQIDMNGVTNYTVKITIGEALLLLSSVDNIGNSVINTEAEIFTSEGKSLGKIPLPDGTAQQRLKAGRAIYIVFTNPSYSTYVTLPRQIWGDKEYPIKATMYAKQSGTIKIEHEGIYSEEGAQTTLLQAGSNYTALFRMTIPQGVNAKKAGFHFRIGDSSNLANDPLAITKAEIANPYSIIKGTTFNPPIGYGTDALHLTEGDAKWVNVEVRNPGSAVIEIAVKFKVKETVNPGTLLTMHYRAWLIDSSNNYQRAPQDDELGNSENTGSKQSLYATTDNRLRFYMGEAPDCGAEYCYSGEFIYDNPQGLYLTTPYTGTINADYNVHFSLTNNSDKLFEKAELYIKNYIGEESNNEIAFTAYQIENAQGAKTINFNSDPDSIEKINLGNFEKGTTISANALFRTKKIGTGTIYFYIIADGSKIYENTIELAINSDKKIDMSITPDVIPAFVQNTIKVKTTYAKEGSAPQKLKDALVRLTKTNPDETKETFTGKTDSNGMVSFTVPASLPGTKLLFEAEKTGYYSEPIEKEIVQAILTFAPSNINSQLDTQKIKEQFFDEKITNVTGLNLSIDSISVVGKTKKLLDLSAMNSYFKKFAGKSLPSMETTEISSLFYTKLSAQAIESLQENTTIDANYLFTAKDSSGNKFDFMIPLRTVISIAGVPEKACIEISPSDWKGATQKNQSTFEFEVKNNCKSEETEIALENLQAQINWSSNIFGTIELTLTDSETGESSTETLEAAKWTKMFAKVKPGAAYYGILTFTPKQNSIGKEAKFSILIDGQVKAPGGMKFVGSTPKAITGDIKIINLEQCLQITAGGSSSSSSSSSTSSSGSSSGTGSGSSGSSSSSSSTSPSTQETPIVKANLADTATTTSTSSVTTSAGIMKISSGGTETKFTIDSSNCGPTSIEISLCKSDSGTCSGGAEGGIQLSKINFTLSEENPSQEISAYRQSIPGMYGIVVDAKIPGEGWQHITTLDLLVEPPSDYVFSLDKYAFVIKGTGSKDTAVLTNKDVVEDITVDASACDWTEAFKKNKDKKNKGMNPALGALPGLLGGLPPLIDAMNNACQNITDPYEKASQDALKDADKAKKDMDEAQKDADKLKQDADNLAKTDAKDPGAIKKVEEALDSVKKKIEDTKTAVEKIKPSEGSPWPPNCQEKITALKTTLTGLNNDADAAKKKMAECTNKQFTDAKEGAGTVDDAVKKSLNGNSPSAPDSTSQVPKSGGTIVKGPENEIDGAAFFSEALLANTGGFNKSRTDLITSINQEKPVNGVTDAASRAGQGADTQAGAIPPAEQAQKDLKTARDKLADPKTGVQKNLEDYKKCINQVKDMVATMKKKADAIKVPTTECKGIDLTAISTKINEIKTELGQLETDLLYKGIDQPLDKIINDQVKPLISDIDKKAIPELKDATNKLKDAQAKKEALKDAQMPAQQVAQRAPNDQLGKALANMAMQAGLGALMGSMMGGAFNNDKDGNPQDPCKDRVQEPVTAWTMDLRTARGAITMDKAGIGADWVLFSARFIGQFESQKIGVAFENQGISEPAPVYSTATFNARRTNHSALVKLPGNGVIGGITAAMFEMSTTGFLGPSRVPGTLTNVQQKFHLKFTTGDYIAPLPPAITENSCLQGTMIGATGKDSLPKTKLNWSWDDKYGINENSCLETSEGVYCDATQFSITIAKRMKKLEDFLSVNREMACPENPGVDIIKEITQNYNQYLAELGQPLLPDNMEDMVGCWVPKSTVDIGALSGTGSKMAIEYFLEVPGNVQWTNDIKTVQDLRELLNFRVYLMKDSYNIDFRRDFVDYYTKNAFLSAPEWFTSGTQGNWKEYFLNENDLVFTRKNLESQDLLAPGIYNVSIDVNFGENWSFFDSTNNPSAQAMVVMDYAQEPYPNSIFYYLPFNANIGKDSSDGRIGYGVVYENENNPFTISTAQNNVISTMAETGDGMAMLKTSIESDVKELNGIASKRGVLLEITGDGEENNLVFSPNYATPVALKISSEITSEPFSALYMLLEAKTPKQAGAHLAFWDALGKCYDFSGAPLAEIFSSTPDRQGSSSDPITNWQYAYAVDWGKAAKAGNVYLRSTFYTPVTAQYTLNSIAPSSLAFSTPDTGFQQTVDLGGVKGMIHNNQGAKDSVTSLQQLFEMVESESVCITNNGAEATFWWNPNSLYAAKGTGSSMEALNSSVSCIKG